MQRRKCVLTGWRVCEAGGGKRNAGRRRRGGEVGAGRAVQLGISGLQGWVGLSDGRVARPAGGAA